VQQKSLCAYAKNKNANDKRWDQQQRHQLVTRLERSSSPEDWFTASEHLLIHPVAGIAEGGDEKNKADW
jgi:hypothetical protein